MRTIFIPLLLSLFSVQAMASDLRIPALVALTGDAQGFGAVERDSFILAQDDWNSRGGINGQKIVIDFEDTHSTSKDTLSAFRKVHDLGGYKVILGPTWADTYQAFLPVAVKSGALVLTPSAEGKAIDQKVNVGPTLITTYPSTDIEVRELLREVKRRGATKLAIISEEDPYYALMRTLILARAKELGLNVVLDEAIQGNTTDLRQIFVNMKQRGADAYLQLILSDAALSTSFRQHSQLAPRIKLYGIHDMNSYFQNESFRPYMEGVVFTTLETRDTGFMKRFMTRFGYAPITTGSSAYDVINMLFTALAAGKKSPDEIRDFLLSQEFDTVSYGKIRFLPEGRIDAAEIGIAEIKNGKIQLLSTLDKQ